MDSEGTANGAGVTLTDEAAEFEVPEGDANDPVTPVDVKALSLVEQGGSFADDRLGAEAGGG